MRGCFRPLDGAALQGPDCSEDKVLLQSAQLIRIDTNKFQLYVFESIRSVVVRTCYFPFPVNDCDSVYTPEDYRPP